MARQMFKTGEDAPFVAAPGHDGMTRFVPAINLAWSVLFAASVCSAAASHQACVLALCRSFHQHCFHSALALFLGVCADLFLPNADFDGLDDGVDGTQHFEVVGSVVALFLLVSWNDRGFRSLGFAALHADLEPFLWHGFCHALTASVRRLRRAVFDAFAAPGAARSQSAQLHISRDLWRKVRLVRLAALFVLCDIDSCLLGSCAFHSSIIVAFALAASLDLGTH